MQKDILFCSLKPCLMPVMSSLKDTKLLFSLKVTCMGWLKNVLFWVALNDRLAGLGLGLQNL